jgi:hypothetical protein
MPRKIDGVFSFELLKKTKKYSLVAQTPKGQEKEQRASTKKNPRPDELSGGKSTGSQAIFNVPTGSCKAASAIWPQGFGRGLRCICDKDIL